jgi:adenosine kinase
MTALICGSMAYDTVMVFEGKFRDHILPDRLHVLNVAFLVPSMRRNFGGCAGNIAYNLQLLGGDGPDHGDRRAMTSRPYAQWLEQSGLPQTHVRMVADQFTAQAYITTDLENNQITAFHPGAMNYSHLNRVSDSTGIRLGIVAPDGRQGMLEHAEQFAAAGVPFVFDPGQGLPMFGEAELRDFIERASWVAVNDYEASLLAERSGWSLEKIAKQVRALIVTRGAEGSWIFADGQRLRNPGGKNRARRRSDRLRRCLSRRAAVRTGARI